MTFSEDGLRDDLRSAAEHLHAPPHLLARARAGGRRRLRRRRALQIAPLLGVLTGLALWVPHPRTGDPGRTGATPTASPGAPGFPPRSPTGGATTEADQQAREAFSGAGYTYDDAVRLALLWNRGTDEAKVTGGRLLLAGRSLPFDP